MVSVVSRSVECLFLERRFPSCNTVVLFGRRPVLVDPGFGSDAAGLEVLLRENGLSSAGITLIVNTHFHVDHAGGNYALQSAHNIRIAAHATEAALVNNRDPDACRARFLCQPVEPYTVGRLLRDGDLVGTGESTWTVLETPGHTSGHIALWSSEHDVLISGDALHDADVGWLNPYEEGPDALNRTDATLDRIAGLGVKTILPGHGPKITDVSAAIARARARVQSWRDDPHRMAWHACKRIFAYALMLTDGMTDAEADSYLRAAPWVDSHATHGFGVSVDAFIPMLLAEMRQGAATHEDKRWTATVSYDKPWFGWQQAPTVPADWPPPRALSLPQAGED